MKNDLNVITTLDVLRGICVFVITALLFFLIGFAWSDERWIEREHHYVQRIADCQEMLGLCRSERKTR